MDYSEIKALAKEYGCSAQDLVALSTKNDPFYVGTPGDIANGGWFRDLWRRFGYGDGVHLRRVHYQIISQTPAILMPDGKPYENTERCWDFLGMAAKVARYMGYVSASSFDDRRNPPPVINVPDRAEPWLFISTGMWDGPLALPDFPDTPSFALEDYLASQKYHVEIWCEKSTMNDVFLPFCEEYGLNFVTGLGELSITSVLQAVRRIQDYEKPCRILYVSDFDPAGKCMPVSVGRKLEYFIREEGVDEDVVLQPIVLTEDQVRQYRLPRTPIKETEKRRHTFEAEYGTGAVELDALEALHPGRLKAIVLEEVMRYYDADLLERVRIAREELTEALANIAVEVADNHSEQIEDLRERYESARHETEQTLEEIRTELEGLWEQMGEELSDKQPDLTDYPIPEGQDGDDYVDPLFDSSRDYMDQLRYYKEHQGGDKLDRMSRVS